MALAMAAAGANLVITARTPAADDELLQAQLKRPERRVEAISSERRRLVDLIRAVYSSLPKSTVAPRRSTPVATLLRNNAER